MRREHILPTLIVVLGVILAFTVNAWAGALGRARLLEEQLSDAQDSVEVAHEVRDSVMDLSDDVILQSAILESEASVAIADAQADVIVQQAEAEASFRRAEALAADNPELERAIQEMRAEGIVTEMAFEAERAESASALFAAQQQIRTLTTSLLDEREASTTEIARLNTALGLAIQRGDALEQAIAPGFFTNLFRNVELVAVTSAVSATATFLLTR